jgi:hypothetical protein
MEDKRCTKHPCSPSNKGTSSPSRAPTPLPSPSGLPPPLGSPPEVSLRRPCSPVLEQGGPSERIPVVDMSYEDEDILLDTSRDAELSKKLFGDLNRDLLGTPDDGKVIVLSDSDEEE